MTNSDLSSNPVRFAYIGCGFVAQTIHIPNFKSLPNCDFVAIAETREDLGKRVATHYGIRKVYRSHEEVAADPEIEAVGVSAPYAVQGKIAEDLIRAGKQVFMEKPMAVSTQRAESIVAAVKETGNRLMVGYMKRYDTGNLLLKRYVDLWTSTGLVGDLLYARNHGFGGNWIYGKDPNIPIETSSADAPPAPDECPAWIPQQWREPYLGYLQQWTHNVNLLRFLLGDTGGKSRVVSVDLSPSDGMTGVVVLNINGTRAVVESAYTSYHAWEEHTQIYFRDAWLKTHAPGLMQKEIPATVEVYRAAKGDQPAHLTEEFAEPGWSYREEAKYFLAGVRSDEPFRSSAEDTYNDVKLFEDIYRMFLDTLLIRA